MQAPLRFFLYLYINEQTPAKAAVDRKFIRNPQKPVSGIVIISINDTNKEISIEYTGPNTNPATVIRVSLASKVRKPLTLIQAVSIVATYARAEKRAAKTSFLMCAAPVCRDLNSGIKKSPFKWGEENKNARQKPRYIFFHPDYTVGQGISPCQPKKARGLVFDLPPIRNFTDPTKII